MPSGGNHGGGRPPSLVRASRENTKFATRLKEVVNVTLDEVAPRYKELVQKGIEMALSGNQAMLKLFIELPFKSLDFSDAPEGPLDYLRAHMQRAGLMPLEVSIIGPNGTDPQDPDRATT